MCDVYVYYFRTSNGPDGKKRLSTQAATLEAIKGRGEPAMESQIVVDHTELDADGFVVVTFGSNPPAIDEITAQIRSLEIRATSRDNEALASPDNIERYMLGLESRELRNQARHLETRRAQLTPRGSSCRAGSKDSVRFEAGLAAD